MGNPVSTNPIALISGDIFLFLFSYTDNINTSIKDIWEEYK